MDGSSVYQITYNKTPYMADTLVDEEPASGSKRGLEVDFDFSSFLLLFGCVVCHLANAQSIDQQ